MKNYLIATLMLFPAILILITPHWPRTIIGWGLMFLIVFLSLPFLLLGELLGKFITHEKISRWIDIESKYVSLPRMSYLIGSMILYFALVGIIYLIASYEYGDYIAILKNYIKPHIF